MRNRWNVLWLNSKTFSNISKKNPLSQINRKNFLSLYRKIHNSKNLQFPFDLVDILSIQCNVFSFHSHYLPATTATNIQWTTWNIRRVQLYLSIERHTYIVLLRVQSNADNFSSAKTNLWFSHTRKIVHLLLERYPFSTLLLALSHFLYISTDKLFTQAQIERYILSVCFSFDTLTIEYCARPSVSIGSIRCELPLHIWWWKLYVPWQWIRTISRFM